MQSQDGPAALFELPPVTASAATDPTSDAAAVTAAETGSLVDHRILRFGHELAWRSLLALARSGRIGQPVLIVGPSGVGKRTLATALAQALVCDAPESMRPCGTCRACRLVAHSAHPDVTLTPGPLRIDAARGLLAGLHLSPVEGRVRVHILPAVDEASIGAANSLLKTLEEPPPHAVLLLTAVHEANVLSTIRSRCRRIDLAPLGPAETAAVLATHWSVAQPQAELLARLSGGALGRALAWLDDDAAALADRGAWIDRLFVLIEADRAERLTVSAQMARLRNALAEGIAHWCSTFRDILLVQHGLAEPVTNRDRMTEITRLATALTPAQAAQGARASQTALSQLAAHANPQLVLDVLSLTLPAVQR